MIFFFSFRSREKTFVEERSTKLKVKSDSRGEGLGKRTGELLEKQIGASKVHSNICVHACVGVHLRSYANVLSPSRHETLLTASTDHSTKDKAKEREREEREKKKVKEREKEKEKKKHKVMNEIKRENGEVKQPIKGWWKLAHMHTK